MARDVGLFLVYVWHYQGADKRRHSSTLLTPPAPPPSPPRCAVVFSALLSQLCGCVPGSSLSVCSTVFMSCVSSVHEVGVLTCCLGALVTTVVYNTGAQHTIQNEHLLICAEMFVSRDSHSFSLPFISLHLRCGLLKTRPA